VDGFSAGLVDDDNILEWQIVIMGYVQDGIAKEENAKLINLLPHLISHLNVSS
jgi:hypothetical protein